MTDPVRNTTPAWPDPAQPGVPLNPERSGYHWLRRKGGDIDPWHWDADLGGPGLGGWDEEGGDCAPADFARAFSYWAPCVLPEAPAGANRPEAPDFQQAAEAGFWYLAFTLQSHSFHAPRYVFDMRAFAPEARAFLNAAEQKLYDACAKIAGVSHG